jgi:ABC-type phosphate transport system substrate-binding protein
MRALLLVAVLAVLGAPAATADAQVQVVVNPGVSVSELRADELRDVFLGTRTAIGGVAVEPVFGESGVAHEAFLKTYLGKSDAALRNYFKTLVFTGKGTQPKAFGSDAEILRYVAATKGAIGYVSASADTTGTRKVQVR